jgi:hypothetical protein
MSRFGDWDTIAQEIAQEASHVRGRLTGARHESLHLFHYKDPIEGQDSKIVGEGFAVTGRHLTGQYGRARPGERGPFGVGGQVRVRSLTPGSYTYDDRHLSLRQAFEQMMRDDVQRTRGRTWQGTAVWFEDERGDSLWESLDERSGLPVRRVKNATYFWTPSGRTTVRVGSQVPKYTGVWRKSPRAAPSGRLAEEFIEEVRREEFPQLPSRLGNVFVCPTYEGFCQERAERFGLPVYAVSVTGRVLRTSADEFNYVANKLSDAKYYKEQALLAGLDPRHDPNAWAERAEATREYAREGARRYWAGPRQGDEETIVDGRVTVLGPVKSVAAAESYSPLNEVQEDWLFHTTRWSRVADIAKTKRLMPSRQVDSGKAFVSLSAKPMAPGFGRVVLIFRKRSIRDRLMEVEYDMDWFQQYPDHAAYIGGGYPFNETEAREEAKDDARSDLGIDNLEYSRDRAQRSLERSERDLLDAREEIKYSKREIKSLQKRGKGDPEAQADLPLARGDLKDGRDRLRGVKEDIAATKREIRSIGSKLRKAEKDLAGHTEKRLEKLRREAAYDFLEYSDEEEWITEKAGKPMPFRKGELVAVVCKNCGESDLEWLRQTFRNLLPTRYVVHLSTAMTRIKARKRLRPLRRGQHDPTPAELFKAFGRTPRRKRTRSPSSYSYY